jgi:hypothetical protein
MTAPEPEQPISRECATALDRLQRRLDGESADLPTGVVAHVARCADCRQRFAAARLLATTPVPPDPPVPSQLTERIVGEVLANVRHRRRDWPVALAGLAAMIALAVWIGRAIVPAPPAPAPELVFEHPTSGPNLRDNVTEAGEAVASLTRRTAANAAGALDWSLPAEPPTWWAMPTLQAPALPLDDAGAAIADGFEPVATSARRAAQLFLRELPLADAKDY